MSKKSISETAFPCGRRKFLAIGALTGAGLVLPGKWIGSALALNQSSTKTRKLVVPKFNQSPTNIRKFVVALPGLGPTGIPVAAPNTTRGQLRLQAEQREAGGGDQLPDPRLDGDNVV